MVLAPSRPLTSASPTSEVSCPHLDLSGAILADALKALVGGAEDLGGIQRYVAALKLKSALFSEAFDRAGKDITRDVFLTLCAFMPTVRRRVGRHVEGAPFENLRDAILTLVHDLAKTSTTDAKIAAFCRCFPEDKEHRFIRDLAAEILHNLDPERYPLMMRWVWNAKANTGVIREIWHADNVDHITIPIPDTYEVFLLLRSELSQYLTGKGIFRDVPQYVDLLCAQVYANYICAQGGTYLRTDFSAPEDPMQHTRRMLGLDGVKPGSNRTLVATIDGTPFQILDSPLLSSGT